MFRSLKNRKYNPCVNAVRIIYTPTPDKTNHKKPDPVPYHADRFFIVNIGKRKHIQPIAR